MSVAGRKTEAKTVGVGVSRLDSPTDGQFVCVFRHMSQVPGMMRA